MPKSTTPINTKWKGLYWNCKVCNTSIAVGEGKEIPGCTHKDLLRLKAIVHVPGTENTRRSKVLKATTLKQAIIEMAAFEDYVLNHPEEKDREKEKEEARKAEDKRPPLFIIPALAKFNAFLNNEGVKEYNRDRVRSKEHLASIFHSCELLVDCLSRKKNIDAKKVSDIGEDDIDYLYDFFKDDKHYSNRSINKHVNVYRFFFKWWCNGHNLKISNPFYEIKKQAINHNPIAIEDKAYQKILDVISEANGLKQYTKGVKRERQLFRDWLKASIIATRLTGFRRETLLSVRIENIFEDSKQRYIKVENHKINRIKNLQGTSKKHIFCPITPDLQNFIDEQRASYNYSPNDYLIAPTITGTKRMKTLSDDMTRGFSHFAEIAGVNKIAAINKDDKMNKDADMNKDDDVNKITLKSVRKRYLNDLYLVYGNDAHKISGHSSASILHSNYIDKGFVNNRIATDLQQKEESRRKELENTRNSSQPNQSLEK